VFGWLFGRSKEKSERKIYELPFVTDIHSHILPGIDDGAVDMRESVKLLSGMYEIGYRRMVLTPHVMADSYRNTTDIILSSLEKVVRTMVAEGIELELHASAEYYLDEELASRIEKRDILTIGKDGLLFETSYYAEPMNLENMVFEMQSCGYRPIMAHPERYRYIEDKDFFYGRLREFGVLFQVNINSFGGFYGSDAHQKAEWLSERGWIDFLGSDLHGRRQMETIDSLIKSGVVERVLQNNRILNDEFTISEEASPFI